jgi:hypothetical protein
MAALGEKTIEYTFLSHIGRIGTGTTLAASTRYDFPSQMVTIPDTAIRTFKSVILECNWRDAYATVRNPSGWRLGITCGSNAVSDVDFSPTAIANTGDHQAGVVIRDVTDYFNLNFGVSASANTVYPSFAMSTDTNGSAQNITGKLIITYQYSEESATTIKTVRIPIQSGSALLGLQAAEIGTTGTNAVSVNQIPALDSFLPETNKSYKNIWFEMFGNDVGGATTNFSASYTVNDQASASRCLLWQALNTGVFYYDLWTTKYIDNTDTTQTLYSISSSAASAFKVNSNLVNRFDTIGGLMCVTYTYTASSSSIMNSTMLPVLMACGFLGGTSASDTSVITKDIWVEETNPVLAQSGVLLYEQSPGAATLSILAGAQTARPYTITATVNAGGHATTHRVDHNSGFTLARGKNTFTLKAYSSTISGITCVNGIFYLNYTSDKSAAERYHNHTTIWHVSSQATTGAAAVVNDILTPIQRTPIIDDPYYFINDIGHEVVSWFASATNSIALYAQRLTGELDGAGWEELDSWEQSNDGELASYSQIASCMDLYNQDSYHIGKMNVQTARNYRLTYMTAAMYWVKQYITYHCNRFTVSGSLSNPAGTGAGVKVDIIRTTDNYWSGSIASVATGGGSFTTKVYDNVYPVYASMAQDATHIGRSASAVAV